MREVGNASAAKEKYVGNCPLLKAKVNLHVVVEGGVCVEQRRR